MPHCQTRYFGPLAYDEDSVIEFTQGLPGFAEERLFLPVELPQHHPLIFLQSLLRPEVCFPTLPATSIDPNYAPRLAAADLEALGLGRQPAKGDVLYLAVIAIGETGTTANMLAPLVLSPATRRGVQSIQAPRSYSHQHRLAAEEAPQEVAACS